MSFFSAFNKIARSHTLQRNMLYTKKLPVLYRNKMDKYTQMRIWVLTIYLAFKSLVWIFFIKQIYMRFLNCTFSSNIVFVPHFPHFCENLNIEAFSKVFDGKRFVVLHLFASLWINDRDKNEQQFWLTIIAYSKTKPNNFNNFFRVCLLIHLQSSVIASSIYRQRIHIKESIYNR